MTTSPAPGFGPRDFGTTPLESASPSEAAPVSPSALPDPSPIPEPSCLPASDAEVSAEVADPSGRQNRANLARLFGELKGDRYAGTAYAAAAYAAAGAGKGRQREENRLAMVRLGIATSLYYALRVRHPPTAAHGLRVAIVCSAWAERLGLAGRDRDRVEVAALLHDVGKIGIPDRVLRKPGKLSVDEQLTMSRYSDLSCEILSGCTDDADLLNTVRFADVWFEGRRLDDTPRGQALPLGSRMLTIAGAYDAITTDHVYRPARSREWAIREIIAGGGTQFDPELAIDFSRLLDEKPELPQGLVVDRWLQQLRGASGDGFWRLADRGGEAARGRDRLFYDRLTDDLQDGVAFTDVEGTVTQWNAAMERLTSIKAAAIVGQTWNDEVIRLRDPDGNREAKRGLVTECLRLGTTRNRKMRIERPGGEPVPVQVRVAPVTGATPGLHGAVIVLRDLSDQTTMQRRLESLHQQATRDPLTGVANRAELDRMLAEMTAETASGGPTFSLVLCDIDHFKRINDLHGHQAGDEALVRFAAVLEQYSRENDMIARYGGEEFLLLAAHCDNATASRRAEAIRQAIERTPLPSLQGESVTASFGVTEFQTGDSPETIFARADRALLKAKDNGRNRVVQLGSGIRPDAPDPTDRRQSWFGWLAHRDPMRGNEYSIVTPVPMELAIEKLRGFVADHGAEILAVSEHELTLRVAAIGPRAGRRTADRLVAIKVSLSMQEFLSGDSAVGAARRTRKTRVHVSLEPIRSRDRRRREWKESIRQVTLSLRSYLMGEIVRDQANTSES